jgi:hypothetical protein
MGEQIALRKAAARGLEVIGLILALHPLGDGQKREAAPQLDDRAHDGSPLAVPENVANERLVDLEGVDVK